MKTQNVDSCKCTEHGEDICFDARSHNQLDETLAKRDKTLAALDKPTPTPTPWKVFKAPQGGFGVGKDNSLTEIFYFDDEMKALEKWMELTGEYAINIVLAVNAHEALKDSLRELLRQLDAFGEIHNVDVESRNKGYKQAVQALAQAEGR